MLSKTKALVAPLGDRGEMSIGKRAKKYECEARGGQGNNDITALCSMESGEGGGNTLPQPGLPALSRS